MVGPINSGPGMQIPGFFKTVGFWQALAMGATGVYLYKAMQAGGHTLQNNPYGIRLNTDRIVDRALSGLPPDVAQMAEPHIKSWAREKFSYE